MTPIKLYHPIPYLLDKFNSGIGQYFGKDFWDSSPSFVAKVGHAGWHYKELYGMDGHNGLDFPVPNGTDVFNAADGYLVEATATDEGYGLRVSLFSPVSDNEAYLHIYCHFKDIPFPNHPWTDLTQPLNNKPLIKRGDFIGHADNTGDSSGSHLHLGLFPYILKPYWTKSLTNRYGGAIDPLPYLQLTKYMIITIQKQGDPTLYTEVGGKLVALGDCWSELQQTYGVVRNQVVSPQDFDNLSFGELLKITKK
jgi:hypothetical protein